MDAESKVWYDSLNRSPLTPPDHVFGIVWPILYTMMAVAAVLVWQECGGWCPALTWFAVGLVLNLMWTPTFFKQHKLGTALVIVLATLAVSAYTAWLFYPINNTAGWLLVPYVAWLAFASYLNWYIYMNN